MIQYKTNQINLASNLLVKIRGQFKLYQFCSIYEVNTENNLIVRHFKAYCKALAYAPQQCCVLMVSIADKKTSIKSTIVSIPLLLLCLVSVSRPLCACGDPTNKIEVNFLPALKSRCLPGSCNKFRLQQIEVLILRLAHPEHLFDKCNVDLFYYGVVSIRLYMYQYYSIYPIL